MKQRKRRANVSRSQRELVWTRDNYRCRYCLRPLKYGTHELTFDHLLPVSRGGASVLNNLVTACRPCNEKKADRTPEEAGMELRTWRLWGEVAL